MQEQYESQEEEQIDLLEIMHVILRNGGCLYFVF